MDLSNQTQVRRSRKQGFLGLHFSTPSSRVNKESGDGPGEGFIDFTHNRESQIVKMLWYVRRQAPLENLIGFTKEELRRFLRHFLTIISNSQEGRTLCFKDITMEFTDSGCWLSGPAFEILPRIEEEPCDSLRDTPQAAGEEPITRKHSALRGARDHQISRRRRLLQWRQPLMRITPPQGSCSTTQL